MARQSTSTKLRVNAKLETFNRIKLPRSASNIVEGIFVDATGAPASLTSPTVFLTWNDSTRSDVTNTIKDHIFGDSITLETGGMAGIVGNGMLVGLPLADMDGAAAAVGQQVVAGAGGKPKAEAVSAITAGAPTRYVYGYVTEVTGGIAWFTFTTTGTAK